ncbi:MAG: hypothetical protein AAFX81_08625 [Pseudomonadota bacterium]
MAVIAHTRMSTRRLTVLEQRRDALRAKLDGAAVPDAPPLPEWAVETLQLAGLTVGEVRRFEADADQRLAEAEEELDELEANIDAIELSLLQSGADDLDGIEALASYALRRLRALFPADADDVFFDPGDARALAILERCIADLRRITAAPLRQAV